MNALWTIPAGILLISWTLLEVFLDLFQPSASGSLSSVISRKLFALLKRFPSKLPSAGPLTIVIVIACWAVLTAIGFALILWNSYPEGFTNAQHGSQSVVGRAFSIFYYSLATLTSLGSGELQPVYPAIRLLAAFESLIGISLITASITWIVLIYPALNRMRVLTRKASVLIEAQNRTGVSAMRSDDQSMLAVLAENVIRVRVDFIHFPIIYYFHGDAQGMSLARSLGLLLEMAEGAAQSNRPAGVRLGAEMLQIALAEIAQTLSDRFVHLSDATNGKKVFEAVAQDHLRMETAEK